MNDSNIKKIKDIQIGEKIIGVKKDNKKYDYYKITEGIVLDKWKTIKPAYKISLENGTNIICSAEHRWLTDRGWKYTIGKMGGKGQRPFLTNNNFIRQLSDLAPIFTETDLFKKGYLAGIIHGDGILKSYKNKSILNGKSRINQFRLTMEDNEGLERAYKYLNDFGIKTNWFIFDKKRMIKGIRKNDLDSFNNIKKTIEYKEDSEYLRGYVSGFYDAEGCYSVGNIIRLGDTKVEHFNITKKALELFNFSIKEEIRKRYKSKPLYMIRIKGNKKEQIRFFQTFQSAILHRRNLKRNAIKLSSKIKSIVPLNKSLEMYDIQTSCETYIADGFVSHNCYGKKIAIRFNRKTEENWKEMTLNDNAFKKDYKKRKGRIMFPTSHDIVPKYLSECIITLEKILKAGNSVLITTKPHLSCIVEICRKFEKYKEQIQFRFTITSINNDILKKYEPGATSFEERLKSLCFAFKMGYKTSVSIEPFLDMDPIPLIKSIEQFVNQTIWIGKLNYAKTEFNTWNNVQKVVQNLKKLQEAARLKLRLKDSIVKLYAKKGVKLPNLLVDFYFIGAAQIEPRALGTAPPGDRTNFKEEN